MINYVEKGLELHEAVRAAGHWLAQIDNVWASSDDAAVQAIIDAFDPLPGHKKRRIESIKAEGVERAKQVFEVIDNFGTLDLVSQIMLSVAPAARTPTARFTQLSNIWTAGKNAADAVNACTTTAQVDAVVVNWP